MNPKEAEMPFPKIKPFKLDSKQQAELKKEFKKIDKKTAEARKALEKALPFASEDTLNIRLRPPGRYSGNKSI